MKTMTCKQLGGPQSCNTAFHAQTFEEIAALSKTHAMKMFAQNDAEHLTAMQKMKDLMADPQSMDRWMEEKRNEFNALSEDTTGSL